MKITPELLETIAAAAEQVRKADMELTLANRNPSPSIYVQRNALRGAENKLQELLSVETVLALVAAVEAGAADSRRLDALEQFPMARFVILGEPGQSLPSCDMRALADAILAAKKHSA